MFPVLFYNYTKYYQCKRMRKDKMTEECKKLMKEFEELKKKKSKVAEGWWKNTGAGGWN